MEKVTDDTDVMLGQGGIYMAILQAFKEMNPPYYSDSVFNSPLFFFPFLPRMLSEVDE